MDNYLTLIGDEVYRDIPGKDNQGGRYGGAEKFKEIFKDELQPKVTLSDIQDFVRALLDSKENRLSTKAVILLLNARVLGIEAIKGGTK